MLKEQLAADAGIDHVINPNQRRPCRHERFLIQKIHAMKTAGSKTCRRFDRDKIQLAQANGPEMTRVIKRSTEMRTDTKRANRSSTTEVHTNEPAGVLEYIGA